MSPILCRPRNRQAIFNSLILTVGSERGHEEAKSCWMPITELIIPISITMKSAHILLSVSLPENGTYFTLGVTPDCDLNPKLMRRMWLYYERRVAKIEFPSCITVTVGEWTWKPSFSITSITDKILESLFLCYGVVYKSHVTHLIEES